MEHLLCAKDRVHCHGLLRVVKFSFSLLWSDSKHRLKPLDRDLLNLRQGVKYTAAVMRMAQSNTVFHFWSTSQLIFLIAPQILILLCADFVEVCVPSTLASN